MPNKKHKQLLYGFFSGVAFAVISAATIFLIFINPKAALMKMAVNSVTTGYSYCFVINKDATITCYVCVKEGGAGDIRDIPYSDMIIEQQAGRLSKEQLNKLLSLAKQLKRSGYTDDDPTALTASGGVQFWYGDKAYAMYYVGLDAGSEIFKDLIYEMLSVSPIPLDPDQVFFYMRNKPQPIRPF